MKVKLFHVCILATILSSMIYLKVAALYHFLIIAMFLFYLNSREENIIKKTKSNPILCFMFYWFLYAAVSILWSGDIKLAAQYTYYIFLIYMYSALFIMCVNDKDAIMKTVHLFILLTTAACSVGMWEAFTGNHLLKNYLDNPERVRLLQFVPGFTYRNPNDFAMFLLQFIPYTFYGLLFEKKSLYKYISVYNLITLLFVIGATESRTILIAATIYTAIVLIRYFKKSWIKILIIAVVGLFIMHLVPDLNEILQTAFDSVSRNNLADSIETSGASGQTRVHLFLNCLLMLLHSGGFGMGAGCHRIHMMSYSAKYFSTGRIQVAHNFIAEFLADYGIFMLFLMIHYCSIAIKKIKKYYLNGKDAQLKDLSFLLVLSILLFPLGSVTISSMIQMTSLWSTIGFIAAYLNICEKEEYMIYIPEGQ